LTHLFEFSHSDDIPLDNALALGEFLKRVGGEESAQEKVGEKRKAEEEIEEPEKKRAKVDVTTMKRKQLQSMAKKYGIKGNLSNERLRELVGLALSKVKL